MSGNGKNGELKLERQSVQSVHNVHNVQNAQNVQMNPQEKALYLEKLEKQKKEMEAELELQKKEEEDRYFLEILEQDADEQDAYEEIREMMSYVKSRKKKAWAQNFDECGKEAEEIFEKFKRLYEKNLGKEDWQKKNEELKALKEDADELVDLMKERDMAQAEIREGATFRLFDDQIRALINESSITNSKTFKMVIKTAKEYVKTNDLMEQLNILWKLQACLQEYAKLRYKNVYKTDVGKNRMEIVTKLLAMTDKFLECKEVLELRQQDRDKTLNMEKEMKAPDLAIEYQDSKSQFAQYAKNAKDEIYDEDWSQIMLPYKRDKKNNNQVTPQTMENYEIDKKFLKAYQTEDVRRQLAAIARIYLKQPLMEFSKEDLSKKNVMEFEKKRYTEDTLASNVMILKKFVKELQYRIGGSEEYKTMLSYIQKRISSGPSSCMREAFPIHLDNHGIDLKTGKKSQIQLPDQKEENFQYQMARELYGNYHKPIDEAMEEQLREFVHSVDEEEQQAENKIGSHEYVKETCKLQAKKAKLDERAEPLVRSHYSQYLGQNQMLGSLLIPFYKDKNGDVTVKESKINMAYNDKFMSLICSNDPEDRVAALASVYLRLKKFNWGDKEPTGEEVSEFGRQMASTKGFVDQYKAFTSCLKLEAEKTDAPMIHYMMGIYDRPLTTYSMKLVHLNNYVHGYDASGKPIDNMGVEEKEACKNNYNDLLKKVSEEMKAEKERNDGHLIQQSPKMEEEMRQLCKEKGIDIM